MYFFLKRNIDDLTLPSCSNVCPHLWTQKACLTENIRQKTQSHCSHHCLEDLGRRSKKFFHKNKRCFRWMAASLLGTRLQGSQTDSGKTREATMADHDGTSKIQARDDITLPILCSEEEVGALERMLHRRYLDENTSHTLLLFLTARSESPSARQRCSIRMKTPKQARLS